MTERWQEIAHDLGTYDARTGMDPVHRRVFHGDYVLAEPACKLIAELEAEVERLTEQSQRWYLADGTHIVLSPEEVAARRKFAASHIAELEAELAKLNRTNRAAVDVVASYVTKCEGSLNDSIVIAGAFIELRAKNLERVAGGAS